MSLTKQLREELDRMVNVQFETPEFSKFLSIKYTLPRARFLALEMAAYTRNRRDCWAYVQGASPLDAKQAIWQHEGEELMRDPRCDTDHYSLQIKECRLLGIAPEEIAKAVPIPQTLATHYAWLYLALKQHWLSGLASSSILERRNNNEIVKGGGLSLRIAQRWRDDLGLELRDMPATAVHKEADKEHSDMIWEIFEKYAGEEPAYRAVIEGAQESLKIDRAFRLALAVAMDSIE